MAMNLLSQQLVAVFTEYSGDNRIADNQMS